MSHISILSQNCDHSKMWTSTLLLLTWILLQTYFNIWYGKCKITIWSLVFVGGMNVKIVQCCQVLFMRQKNAKLSGG